MYFLEPRYFVPAPNQESFLREKGATLRVNKPWNETRDILRVKNAAPTFAQNYCQPTTYFFLNLIFGYCVRRVLEKVSYQNSSKDS